MRSVAFGPFRLDRDAGALFRGDVPVPLAPRPFALLCYLAERPGHLATKDELLDALWPDVSVADAALKVAVREIRKALDDPADAPRFIETVHGRGYRFRAPSRGGDLPAPLTSFVGRHAELTTIRDALAASRLVTLRGSGGSGKTRLAREVVALARETFADGTWWIDLAGLDRADLVVAALAGTLGIRDHRDRGLTETLGDFVRAREVLIVLDNCEHVLAGCVPIVERLLAEGARLRVLATSREPLGLAGEKVIVIPPLAVPNDDADVAAMRQAEAVQLFVERARDVDATLDAASDIPPDTIRTIATMCRRLDGLPLAIELVAARAGALSIAELLRQVERGLAGFARGGHARAGRHQSVTAAIDWTYTLLDPTERRFFPRLAIFAGAPTLEAIEAVSDLEPAGQACGLVAALVDKSLVTVVDDGRGERRYRLLDVVRHYAREKLSDADRATLTARHAAWYARLAGDQESRLTGTARAQAVSALTADRDELRAALAATLAIDPQGALEIAAAIWWWWFHTNQWQEGRDWLEAALSARAAGDATRARALCGAGALAWFQGHHGHARARLEESVALARRTETAAALVRALDFLGQLHADEGALDAALGCATEAVALARSLDDPFELAIALIGLGNILLFHRRDAEAQAQYEESAAICEAIPDRWALGMALRNLGILARRRGETDRSIGRLRDSLRALQTIDERWFVSRSLEELAKTLVLVEDWRRAAVLFGAAEALREAVGAVVLAVRYDEYVAALTRIRTAMGEPAFAAAWTEGRALDRDAAIAVAVAG